MKKFYSVQKYLTFFGLWLTFERFGLLFEYKGKISQLFATIKISIRIYLVPDISNTQNVLCPIPR